MKKISLILATLLALWFFANCASVQTPVMGVIYTSVKGPIDSNNGKAEKKGEACATSILGLVAFGDASIHAAKVDGGITNVATVDFDSFSILGVYSKFCSVVRGN